MKTQIVSPLAVGSPSRTFGFQRQGADERSRFSSSGLWVALAIAMLATVAVPREAWAGFATIKIMTSDQYLAQCNPNLGYLTGIWCYGESLVYDPTAQSVTGFSQTIQYNPLVESFDPTHSGPLGTFSVGGDAPPTNPGIGTQPVQLLPSSGYRPGAPLPGSTLTYSDVNGLLTIDYQLATPVSVSGDVNFFVISFQFLKPSYVDVSRSTVTYEMTGPGANFSTLSFSCTFADTPGSQTAPCGSENPSTGITTDLHVVPEPSSLLLLGSGVFGVSGLLRKRPLSRT